MSENSESPKSPTAFAKRAATSFDRLIHHPVRVFWICFGLAAIGVILDGTAFRLWSLQRDYKVISERIVAAKKRGHQLEYQIQKAQQPEYIERAARDQLDLVKDGDLIFIFSDEG